MILQPIVDFLVRKKINRIAAISIVLSLAIIFSGLIIALILSQVLQFGNSFPLLVAKSHQLLDSAVEWTSQYFKISTHQIESWISEKNSELLNISSSSIGQTIVITGNVIIVLVLIPVYVFMFLFYQPLLLEFLHKVFKAHNHKDVNEVLVETKSIVQSYLVGLLLEALIVAILNTASLLIIGIDYAILLGIIGAILNVIPYIGGVVATALPMIIALATESAFAAILVLAAYILIQFIDNNYIVPKVVSSKVKINALVSIVIVIAGGALWGVAGMFLSIPLIAIVKVIFDHIESLKPWGYLLGDTMPPLFQLKNFKSLNKKKAE